MNKAVLTLPLVLTFCGVMLSGSKGVGDKGRAASRGPNFSAEEKGQRDSQSEAIEICAAASGQLFMFLILRRELREAV